MHGAPRSTGGTTSPRIRRQTEIRRKYRTKVWDDLCDEENIQQVKDANDEKNEKNEEE